MISYNIVDGKDAMGKYGIVVPALNLLDKLIGNIGWPGIKSYHLYCTAKIKEEKKSNLIVQQMGEVNIDTEKIVHELLSDESPEELQELFPGLGPLRDNEQLRSVDKAPSSKPLPFINIKVRP